MKIVIETEFYLLLSIILLPLQFLRLLLLTTTGAFTRKLSAHFMPKI